jgi:hypothetical protein
VVTIWFPEGLDPDELRLERHRPGRGGLHHVDLLLAALADRQHGVVGRRQLLHLGITAAEIEARLRSGHLLPYRRGVYAVGRPAAQPSAKRMAAVLAAGRDARLAGWAGSTQRGLLPEAGRRIDVAVPVDRVVVLPGVAVRRVTPKDGEWTVADGIPTHTVPRLLLDLAASSTPDIVEWAWRQAVFTQQLDVSEIIHLLAVHAGQVGTPVIEALLQRRAALVGELRNAFEALMLSIIREAGLPEPLVNQPLDVGGGLVLRPDFRIDELMLIVESDGKDGHADVEFLLTDNERDARYAALGYATERTSYWEAKRERGRVVGALATHRGGRRS